VYNDNFWLFVLAGFGAQLVDGTLSMAYGVTASTLLALLGVPPAVTSATVHAAETVTTGFSCAAHHYFGNVDRLLFKRLAIPGVAGGVAGAWLLTTLPGDHLRPWISTYLLVMGVVIVIKAFRTFPPVRVTRHVAPLGFGGAFADAVGGGGWGPIVASTLIARGNEVRTTVGTVVAAEFVVTVAISVTFFATTGIGFWRVILGLALGGALAAPIGAWLCTRVPTRPMMLLVGVVIIALSLTVLLRYVP
jgi:uncharacterized membrane protein YfcA